MLHSHSNLGKFWLLRYTLAGTCQFFGFVLVILLGVSWYYVMVYTRSPLIRLGLPRWHTDKESPAKAGDARDVGSFPGLGRPP